MDYSTDILFNEKMLIVIIAFIAGFLIFFSLFRNAYLPFKEIRNYIKMEMNRTSGNEYKYWKERLKMLYLMHIPIVRWFFRKKH